MAYQLCRCAEKRWQKLNGVNQLPKIREGKKFVDGMEEDAAYCSNTTFDNSSRFTSPRLVNSQI
jgi:hypothetical protein